MAFHFKYLNVVEYKIQCSIKEGEDFYITEEMDLTAFKTKLNTLSNVLDSKDVSEIMNKVKYAFFNLCKT